MSLFELKDYFKAKNKEYKEYQNAVKFHKHHIDLEKQRKLKGHSEKQHKYENEEVNARYIECQHLSHMIKSLS